MRRFTWNREGSRFSSATMGMTMAKGTECLGTPEKPRVRAMTPGDWELVKRIYAEGIESGEATFEERTPAWEEFDASRLSSPRLVLEADGAVVGWAALSAVSSRECYRGVAEFSIYLRKDARGKGYGALLMDALIRQSEREGIWTLQATIFPANRASIALVEKFGFRYVGRRERIAFHRGAWCDTVLYERRSTTASV